MTAIQVSPAKAISFDNSGTKLIHALRTLVDRIHALDTRTYEEAELPLIQGELVPRIGRLLTAADTLIGEVFRFYDALLSPSDDEAYGIDELSFETSLDQLMTSSTAARQIADISFIARLELSRKRQQLESLSAGTDSWEHIAVCASVRRRILKATTALEKAICEYEQLEPQSDWYITAMTRSVEIRRTYARFRRRLGPGDTPSESDVYSRIRRAGIAIASLIGLDIYEDLKIRDRQMLRELQHRVVDWLRVSEDRGDQIRARAGLRLWQDAIGLANLLMQVNNRAELRDYDAEVLTEVNEILFGGIIPARRLSLMMLDKLRSLYGLDDELDQCIDAGETCSMEAWRSSIVRVLEQRRTESAAPF